MKLKHYIPSVILTVLLVFALVGTTGVLLVQHVLLNADTFATVTEEQALADKAYASLESYFKARENSTGIPKEVFLDAIDKEALQEGIAGSTKQAFDYLHGRSDSFALTMDFTEMEASVRAFFEDYADTNGYAKDEIYEQKIADVTAGAEDKILFTVDTFKFSVMYQNGWLQKAKPYMKYLSPAAVGCVVVTLLLLLMLVLLHRKQGAHLCYWAGLAALIAGLLLLAPCVYVTATDYFSGFVIKDPQIFAAVLGCLDLFTHRAMTAAVVMTVLGVVLLVLFGVLLHLQKPEPDTK